MSSLINKVKDAVSGDKHSSTTSSVPEGTHGPHSSRVANAADPRVDSDMDHRAAAGSTVGAGSDYTTSDNYSYSTGGTRAGYNQPEGTHGPHSSRIANAMDPRVDSDRDHRAAPTTAGTAGTTGGMVGGMTGGRTAGTSTHDRSTVTGYNDPEGTHGPHSSRIANAMDPRVDSDRDNRAAGTTAGTTTGTTAGVTGGRTVGTSTHDRSTVTGYNDPEGTHGPHSSRIANALDPRVDSDRDNRAAGTTAGTTTGTTTGVSGGRTAGTSTFGSSTTTTGYNDPEGTHGPHNSRIANAMDPRVDSDRDHRAVGTTTGTTAGTGYAGDRTTGTVGGTTAGYSTGSGPGPAPHTAGPHKSDMMNKMDPRVDSDLDGSKTVGGNKTYTSRDMDPTDAAQAPPSVLRKHIGEPSIEHGDHAHDRDRRNSAVTAQELHRGI